MTVQHSAHRTTESFAAPVTLFIQRGCAVCLQVRRHLEQRSIPFEIKWLSDPENVDFIQQRLDRGARRAAPWLLVGDQLVQGYEPDLIDETLRQGGHHPMVGGGAVGSAAQSGSLELPAAALWVANLGGGSVSFVDVTGAQHLRDDLPLGVGAMPCAVGHDPETDVVVVTDFALHRVVFFDRAEGGYLRRTLEASSLPMPTQPGDVATDTARHRFYIPCATGASLVALDSRDGSYVGGSLEAATLALPASATNAVAYDPVTDLIVLRAGGVIAVEADTMTFREGGAWGTIQPGFGRDVKLDPQLGLLYTTGYGKSEAGDEYHHMLYLDARSGAYAFGDLESSRVVTDPIPWTVMADPATGLVFVACMETERVVAFDAASPSAPTRPDVVAGTITGPAQRSMTLLEQDHLLCVSSFDESTVTFLDTRTNDYANGSRDASTVPTGTGPRGMAFVAPWS
jgi:DNA-binding beta-propeller fold protein YncE/glutaredoxin